MTVTIYDGDRAVGRVTMRNGRVVADPGTAEQLRLTRVAGGDGPVTPADGEAYLQGIVDMFSRSGYMHAELTGDG
jgi:hypothetical protein